MSREWIQRYSLFNLLLVCLLWSLIDLTYLMQDNFPRSSLATWYTRVLFWWILKNEQRELAEKYKHTTKNAGFVQLNGMQKNMWVLCCCFFFAKEEICTSKQQKTDLHIYKRRYGQEMANTFHRYLRKTSPSANILNNSLRYGALKWLTS